MDWERHDEPPALNEGGVHIWRACLRQIVSAQLVLTDAERRRASGFLSADRRSAFTASRHLLRVLSGSYLGAEPLSIEITNGEQGKPRIAGSALEFNLSHSGDWALLAFAWRRLVGVDIEKVDRRGDRDRIVSRFFSERELRAYRALAPEQREIAFFDVWTRKEAFIKAHGKGVLLGLDRFDVDFAPNAPAALLETRVQGDRTDRWMLDALTVAPGYRAAICVEIAPGEELRRRIFAW
ncbi:MAG: phosphopantetheinyl transferase [Gemmatimonadetes bacterium]|nr:phosphopantetheinyl transferase [Gemmatimonadota bacterium]